MAKRESWNQSYRRAIVESNPAKLHTRIERAEAMIRARIEALRDSQDSWELNELHDALKTLRLKVAFGAVTGPYKSRSRTDWLTEQELNLQASGGGLTSVGNSARKTVTLTRLLTIFR
jgi:hypothetical protein